MAKDSQSLPNLAHLDRSASELAEQLCATFAQSWETEYPILIEQQLRKISPSHRPILLRELLEIELEIRTARKDRFHINEYLERFPNESELIELVFRKTIGRRKLGDYELLDEIGHGGMGNVYRARQVFLDQMVAVKVLSQHYNSNAHIVSRFRHEMRMIGGLDHPNIVQALNAGESSGTLYLAMEYVDGRSLQTVVTKFAGQSHRDMHEETGHQPDGAVASRFPIGAAAEVIRQAALGLEHASEQGLVHRDIKPANLMVTKKGVVKILDLGLGKFRAENQLDVSHEAGLTQFGTTMGTAGYMAPEQWENAINVDVRADIYSLGCTFFFMLTGKTPLDASGATSHRERLLARLEGNIPHISGLRPDCPPEFGDILSKMLAKEAEDRYRTPTELLQAVTPFANFIELQSLIASLPEAFEVNLCSMPVYRSGLHESDHDNDWNSDFANRSRESRLSHSGSRYSVGNAHSCPPASAGPTTDTQRWTQIVFTLLRYGMKPALGLVLCAFLCIFALYNVNDLAEKELADQPRHTESSTDNPLPSLSLLHDANTDMSAVYSLPEEYFARNALANDAMAGNIMTDQLGHGVSVGSRIGTQIPELETASNDLVQLPGLNGQWWFAETPWFLPYVRERVPCALQPGQNSSIDRVALLLHRSKDKSWLSNLSMPYLTADIVRAREYLWYFINNILIPDEFPPHEKALLDGLYHTFETPADKGEMLQHFRSLLADYETAMLPIPDEDRTAMQYHTIALMQHYIAQQSNDLSLVEPAKASYQAALDKYESMSQLEGGEAEDVLPAPIAAIRQLWVVCLSDSARFSYWTDNDFEKFRENAVEILSLNNAQRSNLFLAEFFTVYGSIAATAGINSDTFFRRAGHFLDISEITETDHPLRAHISERFAWSLVEQCKFKEAAQQFAEALRLRENNARNTRNVQAAVEVFNNKRGLALCKQYQGDAEGAQAMFAQIVQEVETALTQANEQYPVPQRHINNLKHILSSTLERYGDCVFYGGTASFGTPYSRVARSNVRLAAELYGRARNTAVNDSALYISDCKLAIIKAQKGVLDEAKTILDQLPCPTKTATFGSAQRRANKLRHIAELVYKLRLSELEEDAETVQESLASLRRFLLQHVASDPSNELRYRRESLEALLFGTELLITTKLKLDGEDKAQDDVFILDMLLMPFASLDDSRPFFYRFYDLAIQCFHDSKEQDIVNQLRFIKQSRLWKPLSNDVEVYFFYFSPHGGTSPNGIVILDPADKTKPVERFVIPYTRQVVKDAAGAGQVLILPPELANRILTDRAEGRKPDISFSDLPCWYRTNDALQDDDWPFDVPML